MKNLLKKIFLSVIKLENSQRITKYILNILLCFVILFAFGFLDGEMWSNIVSIFFGFVISSLMVGLFNVICSSFEDSLKVTDNLNHLLKIYNQDDILK